MLRSQKLHGLLPTCCAGAICFCAHIVLVPCVIARIPKQLLFGELGQGHRKQGRPCKGYKGTVKTGLKWCNIPPTKLVATALGRQRRRMLTRLASSSLEEERRHQVQSRQRTPPFSSLCRSDNCKLPVPSLRTAIQVQDRPAESHPYPQIEAQAMSSSKPRDHHDCIDAMCSSPHVV